MHASLAKAPQRSILLVDDEALVRMGIALLLEELDFNVFQAANAPQGLNILSENPGIIAVITDYRMADMDGIMLIDKARQIAPLVSAILMTGYDSGDARFDSLDAPHLAKPFGIAELEAALSKVI